MIMITLLLEKHNINIMYDFTFHTQFFAVLIDDSAFHKVGFIHIAGFWYSVHMCCSELIFMLTC